jgi:hypothetical protein
MLILTLLAIICIIQLCIIGVLGFFIWKFKAAFDKKYTDKLIVNKILTDYISSTEIHPTNKDKSVSTVQSTPKQKIQKKSNTK